jgi:hypothetical protein
MLPPLLPLSSTLPDTMSSPLHARGPSKYERCSLGQTSFSFDGMVRMRLGTFSSTQNSGLLLDSIMLGSEGRDG